MASSSTAKQANKPVDRAQQILQHVQVVPGSKYLDELKATARLISTRGKGILAADESTPTIGKRFQEINVQNNEDNRRAYRELLFRANGWGRYCSGVILYEETLNQKAADGTPFVDMLRREGVVIGIKVDKGTQNLPGTDGETMTQGLDGLDKRCAEYYKKGARFAKWRAVLKIGPSSPSEMSIAENAHGLARYAQICQENGLVPIVEPEVLTDGEHDIETCAAASQRVWEAVIKALHDYNVVFEGILLKPSMVLPGAQSKSTATPQRVAQLTLQVLQRTIPPAIPGIFFLSGGQSEEEATINLNAINALETVKPWSLSFSYGRALQAATLKAWKGQAANVSAAQAVFLERARSNSEAQLGRYKPSANANSAATQRLYQADYKY
jgi:fructose-bisphosphate aldolase class I